MYHGPFEFVACLGRKAEGAEPATVRAARAAAPESKPMGGLAIISGPRTLQPAAPPAGRGGKS
jgi:hypothetical protein